MSPETEGSLPRLTIDDGPPEQRPMSPETEDSLPRLTIHEDNALSQLLLNGKRLLVRYPQVVRAILQLFIAEGRHFANTAEGQAWKVALTRSEVIRGGRLIWEAYGLNAAFKPQSEVVPSAWLNLIMAALANPDLETTLSTLMVEELRHGTIGAL
jgi:hypothetical protein